eukprot:CFRG8500T1
MPSLVIPVVTWGRRPPHHAITAIMVAKDHRAIITGSSSGQLCVWAYNPDISRISTKRQNKGENENQLFPRMYLTGHVASVTSIVSVAVRQAGDGINAVMSASEDGALFLWDLSDGRCLATETSLPRGSSTLTALSSRKHVVCTGHYGTIYLVDSATLKVVKKLTSEAKPDWINAVCIVEVEAVDSHNGQFTETDALLAVTGEGTFKLWSLELVGTKYMEVEDHPLWKPLKIQPLEGCRQPKTISVSPFCRSLVSIITPTCWLLYTAAGSKLLCRVMAPTHIRWRSSQFLSPTLVALFGKAGNSYIYSLNLPNDQEYMPLTFQFQGHPPSDEAIRKENYLSEGAINLTKADSFELFPDIPVSSFNESMATLVCIYTASPSQTEQHMQYTPNSSHTSDTLSEQAHSGRLRNLVLSAGGRVRGFNPISLYSPPESLNSGPVLAGTYHSHLIVSGDDFGVLRVWDISEKMLDKSMVRASTLDVTVPEGLGKTNSEDLKDLEIVSECVSYDFRDKWDVGDEEEDGYGDLTASAIVKNIYMARGYASGVIVLGDVLSEFERVLKNDCCTTAHLPRVKPHAIGGGIVVVKACEDYIPQKASDPLLLVGHTGAITCLLYPHDVDSNFTAHHLISGSDDFTIRVWDVSTGIVIHVFHNHCAPILRLIPFSGKDISRPTNCICSLAGDHNVSIYSLDEMRCLHSMGGHMFPVRSVQWRYDDDYFVVDCIDGTIYVWQLGTGHLDRVAQGKLAEAILANWSNEPSSRDISWKLYGEDGANSNGYGSLKTLSTSLTTTSTHTTDKPVPLVKLQRLGLSCTDSPVEVLLFDVKKIVSFIKCGDSDGKLCKRLAAMLTRYVLPWGFSANIDAQLSKAFNVDIPKHSCHAVLGRFGHISSLLPTAYGMTDPWAMSSYMTGVRMACAISLTYWENLAATRMLCTLFTKTLPALEDQHGTQDLKIRPPTLGVLVEFWKGTSMSRPIHQLVDAYLVNMTDSAIDEEVQKWTPYIYNNTNTRAYSAYATLIPNASTIAHVSEDANGVGRGTTQRDTAGCSEKPDSVLDGQHNVLPYDPMAVLVLGLIGTRYPSALSSSTAIVAKVAEQLCVAALEQNTNSMERLRSPFVYESDPDVKKFDTRRTTAAAELLGEGFGTWMVHLDVPRLVLQLLAVTGPVAQSSSNMFKGRAMYFGVLKKVATNSPRVLVTTISTFFVKSQSVPSRIHAMNVVLNLVREIPDVFSEQVPRLVDLVVRSLDPHVPQLRDNCLEGSTKTLQEIVKRYMMVGFHAPSQKLAVGSSTGLIVLYDLKTARRWQDIETKQTEVTAVAFSNDGKVLASYCASDLTLKFWQTNMSLFNILTNTVRCISTHRVPPCESNLLDEDVRLVWIAANTLSLCRDNNEVTFSV